MRFEKWQALGNDYAIVEERELPFRLTPERVRVLCAPHTGLGTDGVLLLSETDERGFVAEVRIFNPDGSEAELSGNGVREAVLYLRRNGWVEHDSFSVRTAAGEIRPRITGPDTCTVDMGRVQLRSERDYPSGGDDGTGTIEAGGREFRFQFVQVGNPQCAIEVDAGLEELDLPALRGLPSRVTHASRAARTCPSGSAPASARSGRVSSSAAWGRPCLRAPARRGRRWRRCCGAWRAR